MKYYVTIGSTMHEVVTSTEAEQRARAGVQLIRSAHTAETMNERFLKRFRIEDEVTA